MRPRSASIFCLNEALSTARLAATKADASAISASEGADPFFRVWQRAEKAETRVSRSLGWESPILRDS